ncbi:MAG TPA: hypothetical protein VNN22_23845 [Verrucomicrobiae bacterium]|nr:hypothetical protein [Verrucomicrobiae bacterium]
MKTRKLLLAMALVGGLGFAAGYSVVQHSLKQQQSVWQAGRSALEADLAAARNRPAEVKTITAPGQVVQVEKKISPEEILGRLKTLKVIANQPRSTRLLVHQFESLTELGPEALPAIRKFLAANEEVEYDAGFTRGSRNGNIPVDFNVPPSLRLGLFETVKNIGGMAAEQVLDETLKITGRGVEVAYLARALQQLAPDKYRTDALTAAHELLAKPLVADSGSPMDKFDRNYLYGVLTLFNDTSFIAQAQAGLIGPDGQIDQVALRYLQQAMSTQSVALASQLWQDPRIAPDQKEPLARVALAYVGADAKADQFYQTAINDQNLSPDARRNLIEDLNQDGFPNTKNLTLADLPLIQKRIALIEELAPNALDQINARAFQEAYKDLIKMQNSLLPKK